MTNLDDSLFPEFKSPGWKTVTFSGMTRVSFGVGTGDDDIVAAKVLTKFVRENRRFRLFAPPGTFAFGFDLNRNDKDDTQTAPVRIGFGKITDDRLVTLASNVAATVNSIKLSGPAFEREIAVEYWPGFSLRFNTDTAPSTRSPINVGKFIYVEMPEYYHNTLVNDGSLNVNFIFMGEPRDERFSNYFASYLVPNPSSPIVLQLQWEEIKTSVASLRNPGPPVQYAEDDVMGIENETDPETGEILSKHALRGSGLLSKKYITADDFLEVDTILLYTMPKKKTGTINIDSTNLGTTMYRLTIYVGQGPDPYSADIVRSDIYVPRDGVDVNMNKTKVRHGGMEAIMCNPGDKIWVAVEWLKDIPKVTLGGAADSSVVFTSESGAGALPTSGTPASNTALTVSSNPPSATSGFGTT